MRAPRVFYVIVARLTCLSLGFVIFRSAYVFVPPVNVHQTIRIKTQIIIYNLSIIKTHLSIIINNIIYQ